MNVCDAIFTVYTIWAVKFGFMQLWILEFINKTDGELCAKFRYCGVNQIRKSFAQLGFETLLGLLTQRKRRQFYDPCHRPITPNSWGCIPPYGDNCVYLINVKVCDQQWGPRGINNHRSTIQIKRVKEPVAEHFNQREDMTVVVIGHDVHGTDQRKFWT
jgi:hypothetical protein